MSKTYKQTKDAEKQPKSTDSSKKKKSELQRAHAKSIVLMVIATLVLVAVLFIAISRKKRENESLLNALNQYMESVAVESSWADELAELRKSELTDEQIIEIAREKFGLVFPNEIILKPEE